MDQSNPTAFDGDRFRDALRPPELARDTENRAQPPTGGDDRGILPKPYLDPLHGEIRVLSDSMVAVMTRRGLYSELTDWLEDHFADRIPVNYEVHWNAMRVSRSGSEVEPHALIRLGINADENVIYDAGESGPVFVHEYERGPYAGQQARLVVFPDGSFRVGGGKALKAESPTHAAQLADREVRGDDAPELGWNGWEWWSFADGSATLDALR